MIAGSEGSFDRIMGVVPVLVRVCRHCYRFSPAQQIKSLHIQYRPRPIIRHEEDVMYNLRPFVVNRSGMTHGTQYLGLNVGRRGAPWFRCLFVIKPRTSPATINNALRIGSILIIIPPSVYTQRGSLYSVPKERMLSRI